MSQSGALALVNARVMVHDAAAGRLQVHPSATSVLVRAGRIAAIGDDKAILAERRGDEEVVDLRRGVVMPGFIDAHIHAFDCALGSLNLSLLPPAVDSLAEMKRRLAERARSAAPGSWVLGEGYDDMRMVERRHPSRSDLDEAASDRPILVQRVCGHMSVANSMALHIAGIGPDTADPTGGTIVRDASGAPTGLLLERAQNLIAAHVPPTRAADIARALEATGGELARHGITTICEAMLGGTHPEELAVWAGLLAAGWDGPRLTCLIDHRLDEVPTLEHLKVVGTKLFADGVVTGRTAAVSEAFEGSAETGLLMHDPARLAELVRISADRGLPVGIHAMGDRGIEVALDAIEGVAPNGTAATSGAARYRIEHCSLPSRDSLVRMHRAGIVPVPQPGFLYAEGEAYREQLGDERVARAYPLRTMLSMGMRPAVSSDAPATSAEDAFNPWLGIAAAVSRQTWAGTQLGADEAISIGEAMACYTANAAAALGMEHRTGSLAVGKDADIIVFDEDPAAVSVGDLVSLRPTIVLRAGRFLVRR
jgi:predicted amidohydrolase YtcJ